MDSKTKRDLLLGFISLTNKFNTIDDLQDHLKEYLSVDENNNIDAHSDQFYQDLNQNTRNKKTGYHQGVNHSSEHSPIDDPDWIYNQMKAESVRTVQKGSPVYYTTKEQYIRQGTVKSVNEDGTVNITPFGNDLMPDDVIDIRDVH